jgi:hypothetical protein
MNAQPFTHVYEVRPRKDKRGVDLISDVLPFGGGNGERCHPCQCARSYHFVIAVWSAKEAQSARVKSRETIADNDD